MKFLESSTIRFLLSFSALGVLNFAIVHVFKDTIQMVEICDNAKDDDQDGLIDINDPDCICEIIQAKSLIPNPSFEDKNCCPSSRSELNCASVWIQASEPTTDYLNTCGWMGWPEYPPPRPFPDGEGIVGFRDGRVGQSASNPEPSWKEYAGACLLSPLLAGKTYLFEFHLGFVNELYSPPINITFFGTTDCVNLPFGVGNQRLGCPTNGPNWVRLGSKLLGSGGANIWMKSSIEVKPDKNITAIAIGPDCPDVSSAVNLYYYFDNLVLADLASFQFQIAEISHPCADTFRLQVPLMVGLTYQWYKAGIALVGETNSKLKKMYGDGEYQVRTINEDGSCKMTKIYKYQKPIIQNSVKKTICKDAKFPFGNKVLDKSGSYEYTFKTKDNCDSTVSLELKVLGTLEDTVSVEIFEGDFYRLGDERYKNKGIHIASFTSSIGCDSIVVLNLDFYKVYFPNIFSPNGDGNNDIFTAYSAEVLVETIELKVYDRWGTLLCNGESWEGRNKNNDVLPGVYTYTANIKLRDGYQKLFSGSVTLLK
jgi:gliding motility-associated-like protein